MVSVKKLVDVATKTVTFEVYDEGILQDSISIVLDSFSPEIVLKLALHGISQKFGDSYAGISKMSLADVITGIDAIRDALKANKWITRSEGVGNVKRKLVEGQKTLSDKDQKALQELLAKCNIKLS